ncbi:MAG: helix-turn-helix transcriptional regulator [Gammaproteobacteria bacterium]|nr:helix-turn-helix transcriptional regulator [Gammaproteobacteria bacterium]
MDVRLDVAWHLGRGQTQPAGATLFRLLQAIDEQGSLTAAAKSVGISYRNAWNLVNQWSERLGQALVIMERGRGASLSPLGRKLLWAEDYTVTKTGELLAKIAGELQEELDTVGVGSHAEPISVFASHCLTHQILREVFRNRTGRALQIENAGSAKALTALADGQCEAAGFHLVDGDLRPDFLDHYRRCIEPERYTVIQAVTRRQGLIVAAGNPKNIRGIEDLVRPDVCIVNRQTHSGTRLLLDSLLRHYGIAASRINGYESEEFTHSAVGALVASGSADAGLGTEASAAQFGLDFIRLAAESYFYAVANSDLRTAAIEDFVLALASEAFRKRARKLAGYNPSDSGRQLPAATVLS